jgi:hypothetical protein
MYQEYYDFSTVVNFGGCIETYDYCWFMWAFQANDDIYYYSEFFKFDTSDLRRSTPDFYENRSNYTDINDGFEYGGNWMAEGGAYFYSFRLLEDVADDEDITRLIAGDEPTIWSWAAVGETSTNFE